MNLLFTGQKKKTSARNAKTAYMLKVNCEDVQKSMEGGNGAGESVVAISEPILFDVAATLNQPKVHPSEMGEKNP